MALSYGVTDYIEGGVITAVIVLNVAIGFYQEFQAEKKMVRFHLSEPRTNLTISELGFSACSVLSYGSCPS